jgi:hypothetical protein
MGMFGKINETLMESTISDQHLSTRQDGNHVQTNEHSIDGSSEQDKEIINSQAIKIKQLEEEISKLKSTIHFKENSFKEY